MSAPGRSDWRWLPSSVWSASVLILTRDFREFIECCVTHDVRFLIVGGYALAAHGHPRATKDLDVWLLLDPENADRIVEALDEFGFGSLHLTRDDFLEPETVIQLGYPPLRIDLLTSISGVTFADCWHRRVAVDVGGIEAGFIALEDLIANKLASGRSQDLVDVERLRRTPETE
jgi:predicted nucleotidyltransferase